MGPHIQCVPCSPPVWNPKDPKRLHGSPPKALSFSRFCSLSAFAALSTSRSSRSCLTFSSACRKSLITVLMFSAASDAKRSMDRPEECIDLCEHRILLLLTQVDALLLVTGHLVAAPIAGNTEEQRPENHAQNHELDHTFHCVLLTPCYSAPKYSRMPSDRCSYCCSGSHLIFQMVLVPPSNCS